MQRLPVGIDDFAKIREGNYYFVDKTMAIGELLDNHGEVLLLTRPRRFGKTLFLSMLYYFLASARGADYRNLFHGLAIERADGGSYMAEQGRRPVLFLSLKDVKHRTWPDMVEKFRSLLSDVYDQYTYLMEETGFSQVERRYFQRVHDGLASPIEMEDALRRLVIDTWVYVLAIPNREVRSIYRSEILSRMNPGRTTSYLMTTMENLMAGNSKAFADGLQEILMKMASVYDTANHEAFYHGLLLGMTTLLVPEYEVKSNRESGLGRYDLAIYPAQKGQCGVILEFKAADSPHELLEKAQEARRQIDEKGYDTDFKARGITNVWKYGVAFYGKRVALV